MTSDEIKSELIKLSAECFRMDRMPPLFVTDWELPKSTPKRAKDEIQGHMAQVKLTSNGWGRRLKALADKLPKSDTELPDAVGRLLAWIRDYGDQKQPAFIADLKTVLNLISTEDNRPRGENE